MVHYAERCLAKMRTFKVVPMLSCYGDHIMPGCWFEAYASFEGQRIHHT